MTVSELIQQLQECDLPDAEVRIRTMDSKPDPTPVEVWFRESETVVIEVSK